MNSTQEQDKQFKDVPFNASKYIIEFRSFVNPKNHEVQLVYYNKFLKKIAIHILYQTLQWSLKND